MVLKKSKHGFNTGNTLRSAALHAISPKSSAMVTVKNLECAQDEIQNKIDEVMAVRPTDYDNLYAQYLLRLYRTLDTISYLPNLSVELSLDKSKRWEILHHLDTICLPRLWPYLPKTATSEMFPFQITYRKSHKCLTKEYYYDYCDYDQKEGSSKVSDSLWGKHLHNRKHHRGIQRKGEFVRGKKVQAIQRRLKSKLKLTHIEENDGSINRELLSVYVDVCRDNTAISKQCSTYKPWKVKPEHKSKKKRKDSVITYVGECYGKVSTSHGVHLISQEAFVKVKSLLGNGQLHHSSKGNHHSQKPLAESRLERDNNTRKSVSFKEVQTCSGSSENLQLWRNRETKNQSVALKDRLPPSHQPRNSTRKSAQTQYLKEYQQFFLTDSLPEEDTLHPSCLLAASRKGHIKTILKTEDDKDDGETNTKLLPSDKGFRESKIKPNLLQEYEITDNKKARGKVLGKALVQADKMLAKRPEHKINIPLWSVLSSLFDPVRYKETAKVQISRCKDGQCSVHHDNESTDSIILTHLPDAKGSQFVVQRRNNDQKEIMPRKKSKKRRKKQKGKQCLGKLLENSSNNEKEALLHRGFLVKIKSSTLQCQYLQQKYGTTYEESLGYPRRFWINISNLVSEIREYRNESSKAVPVTSELAFMNIHAVLLIEEAKVKLPYIRVNDSSRKHTLPHQTMIIQFKSDFDVEGKKELYRRLQTKIRGDQVYSTAKLVEYLAEVYKVMTLEGFSHVEVPVRQHTESTLLHTRHYDWLQDLFDWQYHLHSAYNTYNTFKQNFQSQLVPQLSNLTKSQRSDSLFSTCVSSQGNIDKSGSQKVTSGFLAVSRDVYSYVLCHICYKMIITEGDFNSLKSSPNALYKLDEIAGSRWTVRYTIIPRCGHTVCDNCLHHHVIRDVNSNKHTVISCPMSCCNVVLDPVVTLSAVSLAKYCRVLQQKLDDIVSCHPQWQWCPVNKCKHAVKVDGNSMLDTSLVIECVCRHAWCFSCKREAHWPASCEDAAIYQQWKETDKVDCKRALRKVICEACTNKEKVPQKSQQQTLISSQDHEEEMAVTDNSYTECRCKLIFCSRCFSLPHLSTQVPKSTQEDETVPLSSCHDMLLPVLVSYQAIYHHVEKSKWQPVIADNEAAKLARIIVKARAKRKTDSLLLPSTHLSLLPVLPSCGTEKLFLSQVFHFVYQAHTFMEYVCVSLMNLKLASAEAKADIMKTATDLQNIINKTGKVIDDILSNVAVFMMKLKNLMNKGRLLMTKLAIRMRNINTST